MTSPRIALTVLAALVGALAVHASAAEKVRLSPTFQEGQAWTVRWEMDNPFTVLEFLEQRRAIDALVAETGEATVKVGAPRGGAAVLNAEFGTLTYKQKLETDFEATEVPAALSGKEARIEVFADRAGGPRYAVTSDAMRDSSNAQVQALNNDMKSYLAMRCEMPGMPAEPVEVGQSWDSDQLHLLFGAKTTGRVRYTFERIDKDADGRSWAIVIFRGDARQPLPIRLVATLDFVGELRVNTADPMAQTMVIKGTAQRRGVANGPGKPITYSGTYSLRAERTPKAPLPPVAAERPAANPLGAAPAAGEIAAGTYKDEKITLVLKGQGGEYTGTIKLGEQEFPLKARRTAEGLSGTFTAGDDAFEFKATADGTTLTVQTGGARYVLKRQAARPNPLDPGAPAAPAAPPTRPVNPLG